MNTLYFAIRTTGNHTINYNIDIYEEDTSDKIISLIKVIYYIHRNRIRKCDITEAIIKTRKTILTKANMEDIVFINQYFKPKRFKNEKELKNFIENYITSD